jgi:ubiquinol-cytochrome c reductase iron-sulfur subunit
VSPAGDDPPRVPEQLPLPSVPLSSDHIAASYEALARRPTDPEGHSEPAPPDIQHPPPRTHRSRRAERAAVVAVSALYWLSFAGSALFCVAYVVVDNHPRLGQLSNLLLGTGLGVAMLALGAGLIVQNKTLMPAVKARQHRAVHHSAETDEVAAEEIFIGGVEETGLRRRFVRRSLLAAFAVLPLPFVFALRDTGPAPASRLQKNAWRRDSLLIDADTKLPVKLGDLEIGGIATVVPEGASDTDLPVNAESIVVLIHLPPNVNQPRPGRETWAADDHIAYSKICTHAGCPVGLYEQQTHHLLCPCHQSTFDVARGCKILFGPAPRPLPQLPIYVDGDGYFRAQRAFGQALGPSFWERSS